MACTMTTGLQSYEVRLRYGPMVRNMSPALYWGTASAGYTLNCIQSLPLEMANMTFSKQDDVG